MEVESTRGMERRYPNQVDRWKGKFPYVAMMSRGSTLGFPLLILFALLLGTASPALGVEKFCSDPPYFGVIDGNRHPDPVQITIDRDCTFQNFPVLQHHRPPVPFRDLAA